MTTNNPKRTVMTRKLALIVPLSAALFGLVACADEQGTTAKEPPLTAPVYSPATSPPTNPVTGTAPGPGGSGASPSSPGGSAGGGPGGAT
jgi:hypothetical protein